MTDFDERALIERCRKGQDEAAFGELVDRYRDLVYAMVWRLTVDRTEIDDLAQEVFLKVHRGLPYFRGEARLSTWIYRIVANVCAQARGRPRREVPLDAGPDRPAIDPGAADAAFGDLELRDRLDKAIARLPEHYAFLIAAHHLHGVQYDALAEALDIPIGTVKTHLHRAKRRLRELLEQ
ncbi:MAG TPA: sigma-70 family RNA polymerase sigma factor [Vicinamibacterales bacterium]|nr:sigma-70 family RNA polymerase sigma factor [Vicinamibacterales bacterium]